MEPNDIVLSYFIGLTSGVTPFLCYNFYYKWINTSPFKKFWKEYIGANSLGIVSCSDSLTDRSTLSTGFYDSLALSEVRKLLSSFSKTSLTPYSCKSHPPNLDENNCIFFGGPKNNTLTDKIMNGKKLTNLKFEGNALLDTRNNRSYDPDTEDGRVTKDYGLIIKMTHPYNPKKRLMLFAGCHDYGTYLAAKLLTNLESIKNVLNLVGDSNFEIIISGDVISGVPQMPNIEDCIVGM